MKPEGIFTKLNMPFVCLRRINMNQTRKLVLTALLIALGVTLPQAFHAIPNAGSIFLPMHIPVLLSGFAVGPVFGLVCGIATPLLSHLIFHMPPAPVLPGMLVELAVYGLVSGLLNKTLKIKNDIVKTYAVLVGAMLCGRFAYGLLNGFVFMAGKYSFDNWLVAAFVTALPGIAIQLVLIPVLVTALRRGGLLKD